MTERDEPAARQTASTMLRVRFCETDLMGIVHHANYFQYFEAGRVDWMHQQGMSLDIWTAEGIHLALLAASARYHKAARFDDVLTLETTCVRVTWITVTFAYRITRANDLICDGETRLVCVGDNLAPRRFPPRIATVLGPGRDA